MHGNTRKGRRKMKYTIELKLGRYSLEMASRQQVTLSLRLRNSSALVALMEAYQVSDNGWNQEDAQRIDFDSGKQHIHGKWWLESVLRVPEMEKSKNDEVGQ